MIANIVQTLSETLRENSWVVWLLLGLSLSTLIVSLAIVPWFVVRISPDYLRRGHPQHERGQEANPGFRIPLLAIKPVLGAVLMVGGFGILFMPGPGVLTIVLGLWLLETPGKHAAGRWLVSRPAIFS